jgi:hypothetical protein
MKEPLPWDAPFHCIFPDRLAKGLAGDGCNLPVQICAKLTTNGMALIPRQKNRKPHPQHPHQNGRCQR